MTNYTLKDLKERVLNSDSSSLPVLVAEIIDYILQLEMDIDRGGN